MYFEMGFRNGFGLDVEVVDRLPVDVLFSEENSVEGISVMEGIVISLPFVVMYIGTEKHVGVADGDQS